MTTGAAFRAIYPRIDDLSELCEGGTRRLRTSSGDFYEFRTEQLEGQQVMLPTRIAVPDAATAEFRDRGATVHLRRHGLEVVFGSDGMFVGENFDGELEVPSREGARRAAEAIVNDGGLQRSFLSLARGMWAGTLETAVVSGNPPPAPVQEQLQAMEKTYVSMTRPVRTVICETEEIVNTVTEQIWGWVNRVTTAAEQAAACEADCQARFGWGSWDYWLCGGGCVVGLFSDIVASTWEVVQTVTKTIITYVTHCIEVVTTWPPDRLERGPQQYAGIPSSVGKLHPTEVTGTPDISIFTSEVVPDEEIKKTWDCISEALHCIMAGKWSTWDIDVPDLGIGIDEVPVGLQVCVSKECMDTIRNALTLDCAKAAADTLAALITKEGRDEAGKKVLGLLGGGLPLLSEKVATALGIAVGHALVAAVVMLIVIAYQMAAITAQIAFRRKFLHQTFENGICLRHPIFPLAAVAVVTWPTFIGPLLVAQIAINTPIIVVPR